MLAVTNYHVTTTFNPRVYVISRNLSLAETAGTVWRYTVIFSWS